jgi:hypothetical protein
MLMTSFRQMAKRRFTGSEPCGEKPGRSPSVEILNNGMNPDRLSIDLEENWRREHRREALHPPPASAPHIQIPPQLHHYQVGNISLNDPPRARNEQLQLPLPIASMDIPSPSKTNRTQPHGQGIPNENETGSEFQIAPIQENQARAPKLSSNAIKSIHKQVLLPLLRRPSLLKSKELVPGFAEGIFMPRCENLRDLEEELFSFARVSFYFFNFFFKKKDNEPFTN